MAFRLQSAIAGFAKRTSEKMEKFDDTYFETLKNTSANLANEASTIRKDRVTAARDYRNKGNILINDFGLTEAQVQALLSGGTDRYDKFMEDVQSGAMQHVRAGKTEPFDQRDFVKTLFTTQETPEGGTAPTFMSLDEQAQLYGKLSVPTTIDMDASTSALVAGTQRGIFKMDPATVRSALGDVATGAERYEGPGFTPTGVSYTSPALTAGQLIQFEQAVASKEATDVTTDLSREKMTSVIQARQLASKEDARSERLLTIQERAEARAAALEPYERERIIAQTDAIYQNIANDELTGEVLALQIERDMETGLEKARLTNEYLQAQIISEGTVKDAEALWATSVAAVDVQEIKLAELQAKGASDEAIAAQQAVVDAAATIADDNWKLVVSDNTAELFSKVNLDASFSRRIKQAALGFNVDLKFSSFNEAIEKFGKGQLPAFLTATDSAINQIASEYKDQSRAKRFVRTQLDTLNQQLTAYGAQTNRFNEGATASNLKNTKKPIDFGELGLVRPVEKEDRPAFEAALDAAARDENNNVIARPGDIIRVKTANGGERIYMWGVANDWIGY